MSVGFRDGEDLFFPAYTFPNWTVILRAVLSERITSVVVVSTAGDHIVFSKGFDELRGTFLAHADFFSMLR